MLFPMPRNTVDIETRRWAEELRKFVQNLGTGGDTIIIQEPPPPSWQRDWEHDHYYETITWADYTISDAWLNADVQLYCPQPTDATTKTILLPTPSAGCWLTLTCFFQITGAWSGMQWDVKDPNYTTTPLFSMTSAEGGVPYGLWKMTLFAAYLDNDGATWRWRNVATVRSWNEETDSTLP